MLAHRASFIVHKGKIKKGKFILHKCDNRACVNPEHLYQGTQKENVIDMIDRGRKSVGESSGVNILTNSQVLRIRELRATGMTYQKLADEFKISDTCIWQILKRKTWKHLP